MCSPSRSPSPCPGADGRRGEWRLSSSNQLNSEKERRPGTQATTFLARTSGLSAVETGAYCTLINGLVSDGIITGTMSGANSGAAACGSTLDALYILATNSIATAGLNLCGTSYGLLSNGTITFTADHGYAGNGTTGFLNTQFVPQSATTPNYTPTSASIGAYDRTSSTTVSSTATIIGISNGNQSYIQPLTTASLMAADVNTTTFALGGVNTNRQGAWIVSRTSRRSACSCRYGSRSTRRIIKPKQKDHPKAVSVLAMEF
jgi:hypothetical protein